MARLTVDEALMTLQGGGPVMETAREVSRLLRQSGIRGAVIGGVAVVLHGHVRTTIDVDVFVADDPSLLADVFRREGFEYDSDRRQFLKRGVPVHLKTIHQVKVAPRSFENIDEITTVSLPDLLSMKLRSGSQNLLRAQDLADVIGLMRRHGLTGEFARRIDADLRDEFRKLTLALQREAGGA
jgi:hypothetical protein